MPNYVSVIVGGNNFREEANLESEFRTIANDIKK